MVPLPLFVLNRSCWRLTYLVGLPRYLSQEVRSVSTIPERVLRGMHSGSLLVWVSLTVWAEVGAVTSYGKC